MAIAKIILNGETQMDVTQKTVTAGSMLSGTTALKNDGTDITGNIASQAAQTIHPSTTDQTIASGKYLTGAQTIKAVTTTNLTAANIVQGVTVKIGDSTDDDCVASVTGTAATGGNDFVITLTETSSGYPPKYEPDCTFAEAQAAYSGGKTIAFVAYDGSPCAFMYDEDNDGFIYTVIGSYSASNWRAIGYKAYMWTSAGVTILDEPEQSGNLAYLTNNATAVPADVASGKVFYNASGYQVGTASGGGGGSDADLKRLIERDLTTITFPDGLTKVGANAFRQCTLLDLTSLPDGITRLEECAFYNCQSLALTSLPSSLTYIAGSAFAWCVNLAITSIPSGVTYIGSSAFNLCYKLTSISCTGAITTLGGSAFAGNTNYPMQLAHASFPNMAVTALNAAFGGSSASNSCQQLEDVDIGSAKAIGGYAFANCYKLQTLVLRRSGAICTLSNVSAFNNTPMRGYNSLTGTIYVPSALISTYQTATNWSTIYGEGHVTFAAIEGSEYEL